MQLCEFLGGKFHFDFKEWHISHQKIFEMLRMAYKMQHCLRTVRSGTCSMTSLLERSNPRLIVSFELLYRLT